MNENQEVTNNISNHPAKNNILSIINKFKFPIIAITALLILTAIFILRSKPEYQQSIPIISSLPFFQQQKIPTNVPSPVPPTAILKPTIYISQYHGPTMTVPDINLYPTIVSKLPIKEIAQRLAAWLDKQRNEEDMYLDRIVICEDNQENCAKPMRNFKDGLAAIWGRFKYYQATKNPSELSIVERDIGNLLDPKRELSFQIYFWECKYMFDLWKDDAFNTDVKDKITEICKKAGYYPPEEEQVETFVKNNKFYDPILMDIISTNKLPETLSVDEDYIDEYAAYTSEYAVRHLWFNETNALAKAKIYLIKALYTYINNTDKAREFSGLLATASYDLYQASKDSQYLNLVEYLLSQKSGYSCNSLLDCFNTVYLSKKLSNETAFFKENLQWSADKNIEYIINTGYDDKKMPGYIQNLGAFHGLAKGDRVYRILDNGLMLGLLSEYLK